MHFAHARKWVFLYVAHIELSQQVITVCIVFFFFFFFFLQVLYVCLGTPAGFVSARVYKSKSENRQYRTLITA